MFYRIGLARLGICVLLLCASMAAQLSCATGGADTGFEPNRKPMHGNERYVISGITMESPVVITRVEVFTDGGTMEMSFKDVQGVCLDAFLDGGRLLEASPDEIDEPRALTVGGPLSSPSAKRLERGGEDERELLRMLNSCVNRASTDGTPLVRYDLGTYTNFKPDQDRDRRRVMGFKAELEGAP